MTVIVAGGGLAGAAVACLLARAGRAVRVIEREAKPVDKVCGAFVSAEAQHYLRHLGLDLAALGGAPITGFRLVRGNAVVSCRLPFAGLGLSRLVLDEALLRRAADCGARVSRGQAIGMEHGDPIDPAASPRTDTLFLATGKHDLRGLRRAVSNVPDLVGFKLAFRLSEAQQSALAGHVEIVLLDRGYAGLQLVEHGVANLCLLVERTRLRDAGGDWDGLLDDLRRKEPHMQKRLAGAAAMTKRPLSIFRVPYGFVHKPADDDPPGVYRLGDQMGVIPSFTGDGMSIALHSAAVAAAVFLSGGSAAHYHRRIRQDIAGQIGRAGALYRLGSAPFLQPALMQLASFWPSGLRLAASVTRVPRLAVALALAAVA
jgi:2-polyprenyl-6-methoxyphenol hydroxylase-like FAD-dependent oxidoreductase